MHGQQSLPITKGTTITTIELSRLCEINLATVHEIKDRIDGLSNKSGDY